MLMIGGAPLNATKCVGNGTFWGEIGGIELMKVITRMKFWNVE